MRDDFVFWNERLQRFFGSGLQKELSMSDFLRSVESMFVDRKLPRGADPSFFSNDWAQRAFSKWRNSIAGLYIWRWRNAAADEDRNAMRSAAEYALRQAYQLCPWSTEVVERYASFLKAQRRRADALALADLSARIAPDSENKDISLSCEDCGKAEAIEMAGRILCAECISEYGACCAGQDHGC